MDSPPEPTPRTPGEEARRRLLTAAVPSARSDGCGSATTGRERSSAPGAAAPALRCPADGLSMEHLAAPETVDAQTIGHTLIATPAGFADHPEHEESV